VVEVNCTSDRDGLTIQNIYEKITEYMMFAFPDVQEMTDKMCSMADTEHRIKKVGIRYHKLDCTRVDAPKEAATLA
jgi:hypothetical protein